MARRALTDPDEGARETWAIDAPIAQERWRCSAVLNESRERVYEPHACFETMDLALRSVAEEVAALTGTEPCGDCPMAAIRSENNAWVHAVTRAYRDHEKGELRARHPTPDAVLMDAIDCLGDAVDSRSAHESEVMRKRLAVKNPPKRKEPDDE